MKLALIVAALATACASQPARVPSNEVTTTSAVITPADRPLIVEPGYVEITFPTALPERIAGTPAAMNDSEIVTLLETANQAAMDEATLALAHAKHQRVKDLAQLLYEHAHDFKLNEEMLATSVGLQPEPSRRSLEVRQAADNALQRLSSLSFQVDFDAEWTGQMIRDEKALLDLIDQKLLPSTHSALLEQSLNALRPIVQDELERAIAANLIFSH
jgi:predicted outer membrane protein